MSKYERQRAKSVYVERDQRMPPEDWRSNMYHLRHPLGQLFRFHNTYVVTKVFNALNIDLKGKHVLDVGCGYGHWLRTLIEFDANPQNLIGIDIAPHRLKYAASKNNMINLIEFDGIDIPLSSESVDMVFQVVVFSSILTDMVRIKLAQEMVRVLRPGGYLLWLDHKTNHRDTLVGFRAEEVQNFWPECKLIYKMHAHPRYFRYLFGRFSWLAYSLYSFSNMGCDSLFLVFEKKAI